MSEAAGKNRYSAYEVLGRSVRVDDSFGTVMRVDELLRDIALTDDEKTAILLRMLYADPAAVLSYYGPRSGDALLDTMRQVFGVEEGDSSGRRIMDWKEDAARIRVTMREAYGLGDEFMGMPYKRVCELIGMAPHDTPMGQALYYRTAKRPKPTKYNKAALRHFDICRAHYMLGGSNG